MKKYVIIFALFLRFVSVVFAQEYAVDKGSTILSALGSFSNQGGDLFKGSRDNRQTSIMFSGSFNKFIAKNISFGTGIAFTRQEENSHANTSIAIGPTLSYFFGNSKSTNYPFVSSGIHYYSIGDGKNSINGTDILFDSGIVFLMNRNFGFVFDMSYHIMKLKDKDWDRAKSGNIFIIGFGLAGIIY